MARVHVLRHGESTANVAGVIVSRPGPRALVEVGLTPRGREQARAAAESSFLGSDAIVLTSDFARAAETAQVFAETIGAPAPIVDERLRERVFGLHEEGPATAYEQVWAADAAGQDPGEGVETVDAVADRALAVLASARERSDAAGGAPVVLVAHGDVLQILLAAAAGRPPRSHRAQEHLGNAELRAVGPQEG